MKSQFSNPIQGARRSGVVLVLASLVTAALVAQTPGTGSETASLVLRVIPRVVEEIDAASPDWPGG